MAEPGSGAGGLACNSPGNSALAGEALPPALMPLQPEPINATAGANASQRVLHFNLTEFGY